LAIVLGPKRPRRRQSHHAGGVAASLRRAGMSWAGACAQASKPIDKQPQ
jgi:hypothetical protein